MAHAWIQAVSIPSKLLDIQRIPTKLVDKDVNKGLSVAYPGGV